MKLREAVVLGKVRASSLEYVKHLNLWGNDLSDNCKSLEELYLRKNAIADLRELRYIAKLPKLRILWLCDNACANDKSYRAKVLAILPELKKLDSKNDVNPEEVEEARSLFPSLRNQYIQYIENEQAQEEEPSPAVNQVQEKRREPEVKKQPGQNKWGRRKMEKRDFPEVQFVQKVQKQENHFQVHGADSPPQRQQRQQQYIPQQPPRREPMPLPLDLPGPPPPDSHFGIALPPVEEVNSYLPPPSNSYEMKVNEQKGMIEKLNMTIQKMKVKINKRDENTGNDEKYKNSKSTIFTAVLSLIRELDVQQLDVLGREVENLKLIKRS